MATISKKLQLQFHFTSLLPLLINKAISLGYGVTLGDAYRGLDIPYGHPDSLHRHRLAIDINLFRLTDGRATYLTSTEDHTQIGEYWESLGGTWGGRFGDGNHYSLAWNRMR